MIRRVLVIGGGAREAALVWALQTSNPNLEIHCAPGNAGISKIAKCHPIKADRIGDLLKLALAVEADLTIVGPEAPLVGGIVDVFNERNLAIIGPDQKAAILEGSKVWAKRFMERHNIPTAPFRVFDSAHNAIEYIKRQSRSLVVKADGLCGGKGVYVYKLPSQQIFAVDELMLEKKFGDAGNRVVIESCLVGYECSLMVLADGSNVTVLPVATDYKRRFDKNEGPNTGGMGCYAPVRISDYLLEEIMDNIVLPTIRGMAYEGRPYRGILYFGLMITEDGPKVLEYNVRFGDPETQAVLPLLGPRWDFASLLEFTLHNCLDKVELDSNLATVGVALVDKNYPSGTSKPSLISGLDHPELQQAHILVFHGNTITENEKDIFSLGGRVVTVVGRGADIPTAQRNAYRGAELINFENKDYRRDIAANGSH